MKTFSTRLAILALGLLAPIAAHAGSTADLGISADAPATAIAGETLLYEIGIFNSGPDTADNVLVDEVLPAGVTLIGDSLNACSVVSTAGDGQQTIQCALDSIEQFGFVELDLLTLVEHDFLVDRGVTSAITTPTVSSDASDPDPSDDTDTASTIIEGLADLEIMLFGNVAVAPAGQEFTYYIIVENNGPSTAENLVIQDTIVTSEFIDANGCSLAVRTDGGLIDQFDCNFALSVGVFELGTMGSNWLNPRGAVCDWDDTADPGEEENCGEIEITDRDLGRVIITINMTADEAVTLNDIADVISDTPDPDPGNNITTTINQFEAVADLGIDLVATTPTVATGEMASWQATITNNGPSAADNVAFIDRLPAGLIDGTVELGVSYFGLPPGVEGGGGFCTSGTPGDPFDPARCDLGGLPDGAGATIDITGMVDPDFLASYPNMSGPVAMDNDVEVTSDTIDAVFDGDCSVWPCPPAPDEPNFDTAVVMVGSPRDFLTEVFGSGALDLDGMQLELTPDASPTGYSVCVTPVTPLGAIGGTNPVFVDDDDFQLVNIPGGNKVKLYGFKYEQLYVSSNGYVTFGSGDDSYIPNADFHFVKPRVAPLFADLDPSTGGDVWWKALSDRMVVGWENVPAYLAVDSNTIYLELFHDGRIVIRYPDIDSSLTSLVGLSDGNGAPTPFFETDFVGGGFPVCAPIFEDGFEAGGTDNWNN